MPHGSPHYSSSQRLALQKAIAWQISDSGMTQEDIVVEVGVGKSHGRKMLDCEMIAPSKNTSTGR
jgi:hypothetical protein